MATHARKRQYQPSASQPSITSYFDRSSNGQTHSAIRPSHSPLSPPVPDNVQSLLINVGMRVRKSVPEGYKTHKTLTPLEPSRSQRPPSSSAPATFYRARELTPFCGLHETGGYGTQTPSSQAVDAFEPPSLTYSQSSLVSSASTNTLNCTAGPAMDTQTRKRAYDEEIEDDLDAFFDEQENGGTAQSFSKPRYPVSHSNMPDLSPTSTFARPLARPKARLKTTNNGGMELVNADGDFDESEAAFLQPMEVDD